MILLNDRERRFTRKALFLFAQLGFTVVTPIVLFLFLALYLKNVWNVPDVVTVLLILAGVATGVVSAVRMIIKATVP